LRVAVAHAIKLSGWRDANADPIAAPYAKDRVENPKQQKGAIFRRTTVLVCAMVASILQELVKQIAIEHRRTAGNVPRLSPSVQHCAGWQRVKQVGGPERTLASLDAATGLRVNELLKLGWGDVNLENLERRVTRSIWHQVLGNCKAEASAIPVPMDSHMAEDLPRWRRQSIYASDDDYVFASETMRGKQPFWPDNLMKREIRPVAKANSIHEKIGWHTSRHSFVTLLKANGEDVKTVQELLRHANSKSTLDVYTHAVKPFPPRSD
jgi:integrase